MTDARLAALRQLDGLAGASEDVVRALAERFRVRAVAGGESLCEHGQPSVAMWVVVEGDVGSWRPGPDGDVSIGVVTGHQPFGQIGMFARAPRTVSCRMLGDGTVLELGAEAAEALLHEVGPVGRAFRHMVIGSMLRQVHVVESTYVRMVVERNRKET